jgi:hypothetical protein
MTPMHRCRPATPAALAAALLAACTGGTKSTPLGSAGTPVEILSCRARVDSPFQFAEIALRDAQNLGTSRVSDRTGTERNVRLHPDGRTVVFARERTNADADSRELFVSTIDGSAPELRLTQDNTRDDEPCWSPDGARVLFASTRGGNSALWTVAADGSDVQPFVGAPPGAADGEPDWCRATDRVVFSRRDGNAHHTLWLAHGNGTGSVQMTDGGPTIGAGFGDHAPAFSPDGSRIAFVRRIAADATILCLVDVATWTVTERLQPDGEVAMPRWAPTMDRLFCGLAEPGAGRATRRLAMLPVASGEPVLLWPDERWQLEGLDLAPTLPAAPAAAAPRLAPVTDAQIQIATGSAAFGVRQQLVHADGDEFVVLTSTIAGREIAGINCRFDLPVAAADDVLELHVRAVARTSRAGQGAMLRMSIYNPVDERFDTVVEFAADDTSPRTMQFRTSSLRHVTREKQLRVTVIGDLPDGDTAELRIDQVQVELVARAN